MADDFRTRTRNLLGLNPLQGSTSPRQRSAYARFTAPGQDTSRAQLLAGALLYTVLTVFSLALVIGSAGVFGRAVFAVLAVLGFLFTMQRLVMAMNRRDDRGAAVSDPNPDGPRTTSGSSSRTGRSQHVKKGGGAHRSGDPRRSG